MPRRGVVIALRTLHRVLGVLLAGACSHIAIAQGGTPLDNADRPAPKTLALLEAPTDRVGKSPAGAYSSSVYPDDPGLDTSAPASARAMSLSTAAAARNARDINAYPSLGVSFGQTIGSLRIYVFAQDRSAQVPAVVYYHPSGHFLWFRFDYMMQAIPVYILHQPKYYDYNSVALTTERRVVLGAGLLPVGERMILNPTSKLQVSFYSCGGFTYFTRRILSEGGTRFNIALQFGNSYQYPVTKNSSLVLGYAVNHLSNSNLNLKNPGLDSNLAYVQYIVHLHRRQ